MAMSQFSDSKLMSRDTVRWAALFFGTGLVAFVCWLLTLYVLALLYDFTYEWGMPTVSLVLLRFIGAVAVPLFPFYWCLLGAKAFPSKGALKGAKYVAIFAAVWWAINFTIRLLWLP